MKSLKKCSIILVLIFLLSATGARTQSISQLLTELALDIQKLSELKTVLNDLYTGYQVVDNGYTTVKNISEGTFHLHKTFLDALLTVSPAVKNYSRVEGIINAEYAIVSEYKTATRHWQADGHFTAAELNYIGQTCAALFQQSEKEVDELDMVLAADSLRASDAERMRMIDRIYGNITGQLSFLRQFNAGVAVQSAQRSKEANDITTMKRIYGIGN
jgi:hypothetical protein